MKWNQIQKRIYGCLAGSVRGRISFGIDNHYYSSYWNKAWIAIDKRGPKRSSAAVYVSDYECYSEEVEWYYSGQDNFRYETPSFTNLRLARSLEEYLTLGIDEILRSRNLIIKAVGMLDGRIGKRRLKTITVANEHLIVKHMYCLRCSAEGVDMGGNLNLAKERDGAFKKIISGIDSGEKDSGKLLAKDKRVRNFKKLIAAARENKLNEQSLKSEIAKVIYEGFANSANRKNIYDIFRYIDARSKVCHDPLYVKAIFEIVKGRDSWIRPLNEWKVTTHNRNKQFCSLLRHLWARYDVPEFMDKAWLTGNELYQEVYKQIGIGKNIRNNKSLPIKMTKKTAHYFLTAPDSYSIEEAFRWGQVMAAGGDERLADAIVETRLKDDFRDDEFWVKVIEFLARNPMLDVVYVGPVIDYIWNQKYEDQIVFVDRGVAENRGPAQPEFSMKGRTVGRLLRAVKNWHNRLGKESGVSDLKWEFSGIAPFNYIEGECEHNNMRVWRISELVTSRELITEGRKLRHCVATYAHSCNKGKSSIWSMELETESERKKCLTIEVYISKKEICQVRGLYNRFAKDEEKAIIRRWAENEDLYYARRH